MKTIYRAASYVALISVATPSFAKDKWIVQPIQGGQETVRYQKGVPTVDLELKNGVVQVTPLPLDHGSLSFGIAVYNDAKQPANMGIENISFQIGSTAVAVFKKDDLERKAKNRAMWASIALAAAGGIAAAAAANQRDHYRSTLVTPRGTYRSYWSAPSAAGQIQSAALVAGTGVGIAAINNQLDNTLVALSDEVIQLTTVDPGESYAGRIVVAKIKPKTLPTEVRLTITWNGEAYPFTFQIAKPGTPAPVFNSLARQSDLTDFSAPTGAAPATNPEQAGTALAPPKTSDLLHTSFEVPKAASTASTAQSSAAQPVPVDQLTTAAPVSGLQTKIDTPTAPVSAATSAN
jgi:hypothetical protein